MADVKLKIGQIVSYEGEKFEVWNIDNDKVKFVTYGFSNPKYELPLNKVRPLEEVHETINNCNRVKLLSE